MPVLNFPTTPVVNQHAAISVSPHTTMKNRRGGVVWALYLSADDPGYGYIDETTPEVSLWVSEEHRGRGLGRVLLHAIISEAAARNLNQMSLSVEADNFARNLYLAEGFAPVVGREKDGVMLRILS